MHGHVQIDRARYFGTEWAADEAQPLLAIVPDKLLQRVLDLKIPARWLAGQSRSRGQKLRRQAYRLGSDYALAVPSAPTIGWVPPQAVCR